MGFKIINKITYPAALLLIFITGCATFTYKTYDPKFEETSDDPEPNYNLTLNEDFQDYTNFMYPGNRMENFVSFFNTFYNAKEQFNDAYNEYVERNLENYSDRIDSAFSQPQLSQEAKDKFTKTIEKCSKIIQYHKSSDLMDDAVLMIGKAYYYTGDYLKAERKFSEFISKLSASLKYDEAIMFLSKSQLKLNNNIAAITRLNNLIDKTTDQYIKSESYRSLAEYYLSKKDFDNAIKNYESSIRYSDDDEFKAQMQYIIASIFSKTNPDRAAREFNKVLNYSPNFQLEYLTNYNYTKFLILSNNFITAKSTLEKLRIKYKDEANLIPDIELLAARLMFQRKEYTASLRNFKNIISNYPQTVAAADAAYYIAVYYETDNNDYLNAYRYFRFSAEQNGNAHNRIATNRKINAYKRYFDLRSAITGTIINTDYDTSITRLTKSVEPGKEIEPGLDKGFEKGKGQGYTGRWTGDDSILVKAQIKANQMFELSELFLYELNNTDSAEYYLQQAFDQSADNDFKSKILFALANLYSNQEMSSKSNEVLNRIIELYPASIAANESRKLLKLPLTEVSDKDNADSLYRTTQEIFLRSSYDSSMIGFREIINNYSDSKYLEQAYYAIGWIYENVYFKPDSAFYYYSAIMNKNPLSTFAPEIADKILEYQNNITGDTNTINNQQPEKNTQEEIKQNPTQEIPADNSIEEKNKIETPQGDQEKQDNEGNIIKTPEINPQK